MAENKMQKEIFVTVIVPVYKVEGTLEATVRSIQVQTHEKLEIILVDDGSPDSSGKLCDRFAKKDSRIKVIHQENAGVSAARNAGIAAATSDYLCFVDSDDEIVFNFVEKALEAICESESQLAVCGISNYHKDKTEYFEKTNSICDYSVLSYDDCLNLFSDWIMSLCVGKLFSRKIIAENKLQFKEGITCAEDALFMYTFLYYCQKVIFTDSLAYRYYYFRSNSNSHIYSLESSINLFNAKKSFLEKHCSEEQVKLYCANKSASSIHSRFTYLAKKQIFDIDEINSAFDYYMPYFLPYSEKKEFFSPETWEWLEKNKTDILNRNGKSLYKKALKQRKSEKYAKHIKEFKNMSLKKKIKFIIKKFIG